MAKILCGKGQSGEVPTIYFPGMGSINILPLHSFSAAKLDYVVRKLYQCYGSLMAAILIKETVPSLVTFLLLPIGRLIWKAA